MRTPEGWSRVQILFQTLREPPPRGSVRESVLRLYVMQKEEAEHAKFRALAQLLLDKEAGAKAFEEYFDAAFPHIKAENARNDMSYAKYLHEEVVKAMKQGGLRVSKVSEPHKVNSRLKVRYDKRSKELADKVVGKIGQSMRIP